MCIGVLPICMYHTLCVPASQRDQRCRVPWNYSHRQLWINLSGGAEPESSGEQPVCLMLSHLSRLVF